MAKIAIADDDPGISELLKTALEAEGHTVNRYSDGLSAYEGIQNDKPELIILDVMMPNMNGYEVCEKIKSSQATKKIPVIMLTSMSQTKDKITGLKLGADDYLTKPFDPYEIVARVDNLLSRFSQSAETSVITGLPGNVVVEKEILKRIENSEKFAVLSIDIDNFKTYNESYGFEKGDMVIKHTSDCITAAVKKMGTESDLVVHMGGDDFMVVTVPEKASHISEEVIKSFEEEKNMHYSQEDISTGFVTSKDRNGKGQSIPLMAVSIGIVTNEQRLFTHYAQVIEVANEVRLVAKKEQKSAFFKDRRTGKDRRKSQ